jgi:hypothetical protein
MRVSWYRLGGKYWPAALLIAGALSAHALPRGPKPEVRLQLADLGFPGVPQALHDAGASMLSVHFVDSSHLLLTYSLRGLVERIPDDPPDDEDRAVAALLLELPSGKVLARARWHLHDHAQYLWNAGNGRFLLRIRSTLTAIAPLANLGNGDAFRQMPFLHPPGNLSAVVVSPEHDLVTVESSRVLQSDSQVVGDTSTAPLMQTFTFVRITGNGSRESPILAVAAGSALVSGVVSLPINGRGYLFSEASKKNHWKMQFQSFDGTARTLSDIDSSCAPQMQFVSPSQFVVFSCRGSNDNLLLSAFDFAPHEMWEEPISGIVPFDQFAYAQSAGRFALSRTALVTTSPGMPYMPPSPGQAPTSAQEVRVYQVESGDLLVKLTCSPATRTGQNFDLSADGSNVVVLRDGVIEVYRLPPLSPQDKKDLAEVRQYEPPPNNSHVQLQRLAREPVEADRKEEKVVPAAPASAAATASAPEPVDAPANVPANAPASTSANAGDVETRRKPPTLLNPGETVENGKKSPNQ